MKVLLVTTQSRKIWKSQLIHMAGNKGILMIISESGAVIVLSK